jgi:TrmH family RNA methyltransferase
MEPVHSRNSRVVAAARLHRGRERRSTRQSLIEGPNLLVEALDAGLDPEVVFALATDQQSARLSEKHGIELVVVDEGALSRLAGTKTPRGPVAVIDIPAPGSPGEGPGVVVSWGVADPGNVGALIRIAAAFGWGFAYTPGTADPWAPKVLRSGAGAQFRSQPMPISTLADLDDVGYTTVATVVEGGAAPESLVTGPYAVLVGQEAGGLPPHVVERAATKVTIPMPGGTESLNAAIAAGIIVYEASRLQAPGTRHGER